MSHEVNEQIKEICYAQAEKEVNRYLHTLEKESEMEDLIDAKAMVLYNNWRSND